MISDPSGRYLATQLDNQLWRYDARWRTARMIDLAPEGTPVRVAEGAGAITVTVHQNDQVTVTLRGPEQPEEVLAKGVFENEKWTFSGDASLWALVPDYVLVPDEKGHNGLLRLADGAEYDPLEGMFEIIQAVDVPESRQLLLVSAGGYSIYDPTTQKSFGHHELAEKNSSPVMRFRNPTEVWINDSTTMLKLDAQKFDAIDAAGSHVGDEPHPDTEVHPEGAFGRWTFAGRNELCVVPRPYLGDVLILDAVSLLPVAQASFSAGGPVDATMIGRNTIVAVGADGRVLRSRAQRVRIPKISPPEN